MTEALSNEQQDRYWHRTTTILPPDNQIVDTMISDIGGERNQQQLKRRGRLWYYPDDSMYVSYIPTHWSEPLTALEQVAK